MTAKAVRPIFTPPKERLKAENLISPYRIATVIGAFGKAPLMSGEYMASTRVGGRVN
jgi:hypothetical protein